MSPERIWRWARLVLVLLALLPTAWFGLAKGTEALRDAVTAWQWVAVGSEILYGAAAALSVIGLLRRAAWARPLLVAWAASLTATAALAPVAWGGQGWGAAAAAAAATLAVALLVRWGAMAHLRRAQGAVGRAPAAGPAPTR